VGARRGSDGLAAIAAVHPDAAVAVSSPTTDERDRFEAEFGGRARFGPEALLEAASLAGSTIVNGIVGAAGLAPSVAALEAGNRLALANKESLVAGGPVIEKARRASGADLIPVDSEHSALADLLEGEEIRSVARVVLPASGGPFRGRSRGDLEDVTVVEALAHPTWDMGPRITIDSATLMNKAFEVIEAHFLFGFDYDKIEVVVHPQSIVHGIVEFIDGALRAHVGDPDMRVPIQRALTHPDRRRGTAAPFVLAGLTLEFEEPDLDVFPALAMGYAAGRAGGSAPAVLNAADEVAVGAFLEGRIGFPAITEVVSRTLDEMGVSEVSTVEDVLAIDAAARAVAAGHMGVRANGEGPVA